MLRPEAVGYLGCVSVDRQDESLEKIVLEDDANIVFPFIVLVIASFCYCQSCFSQSCYSRSSSKSGRRWRVRSRLFLSRHSEIAV